MTPSDIRRLQPEAFEFLWRTILRREHGTAYKHVDGYGIDCLTKGTAYQLYHHQGAPWSVVQDKFRRDLKAAQQAREEYSFDEWVFITTFSFKAPDHRAWLDGQRASALPLGVTTWGDEDLCAALAPYPDLAAMFALGPVAPPGAAPGILAQGGSGGHGINIVGGVQITQASAVPTRPADTDLPPKLPSGFEIAHGIVWDLRSSVAIAFCEGCRTGKGKFVALSCLKIGSNPLATLRRYRCPHGHPEIVLGPGEHPPIALSQLEAAIRSYDLTLKGPGSTEPDK